MVSENISRTRLEKLLRFCRKLSWSGAKDGFYESISAELLDITEADTVVLRLFSEASESMVICAIATNDDQIDIRDFKVMPLTAGRMPGLMQTLDPILIDFDNPHEEDVRYEYAKQLGYKYAITIPLISRGSVIGVADLSYRLNPLVDEDMLLWIDAIGSLLGVVMDNAAAMSKAIELKVLEERRNLCNEIHENLAQSINVAKVEVERAADSMDEDEPDMAKNQIGRAQKACAEAYGYIRDEMRSLRNSEHAEGAADLRAVVEANAHQFQQQWGIPVKCEYMGVDDLYPVPLRVILQIERILHEALANALRHSSASEIIIGLNTSEFGIALRVEDDGCGFDMQMVPEDRMGIKIMDERADSIGASLKVSSKKGIGTVVALELPESYLVSRTEIETPWVNG